MIERDETRERFLAAIADRLDPGVIAEAHLFPPIRQGGQESGVAVLAVKRTADMTADTPADTPADMAADTPADMTADTPADMAADTPAEMAADTPADTPADMPAGAPYRRLTVYSAKYRLAIKGPERGKWEFSMQAEADAPLVTIDEVVRGVQRRSGDQEEPIKITGEELRALLPPAVES